MEILHEALGVQGLHVPCLVNDSLLPRLPAQPHNEATAPPEGTAVHLQLRFFFQLLQAFHSAFDLEWNPSWFIRHHPNGERTVSTTALVEHTIPAILSTCVLPILRDCRPDWSEEGLLRSWQSGLLNSSEFMFEFVERTQDARLRVTELMYESLQALNATLKTFPPFRPNTNAEDCLQSTTFKVLLAIGVLYETLAEIFISSFTYFETGDGLVSSYIEEVSVNADTVIPILQALIAKKGRCLARTSGLEKCLSAWYLLYILPYPGSDMHAHCQPNRCSARRVTRPATSVSCHTSQCGGECTVLHVDNEVVVGMLEACEFPVVAEAKDCANAPVVPAADASSAGRWIAISHVWAHGLGNPEANAILRCRYNWLMSQAHRISSAADYPIWLDTLCVPVGERYIKHREMAINQMRRVYEDAAFVLVLDSRLLSISGVNIVTCQLELLMCDWMQRLWTLQEGALPMPEKVVVAFKDCLLTLEQLTTCQHLREYTRINLEARLAEALQREFQFQDLVVQKESEDKRRDANESRMMALVQSMSHRSTSQLRDEAIVFANLLGFHFGLRSHMPTMETIYNSLTALPGEIIFRPGSRSPIPHLRSLPSSFLAQNQDRMIEAAGSTESKRTRWARVTDHGVVLKRPSLKLQVPQQITLENQIIVMCEGHSLCVVPTSKTLHEPGSSLPVTDIMINRLVYLRVPQAQNQDFDAVLVNIHGNHDEELDARFIGTAVMKRVVGEGASFSSVVSAEVRDFTTWCLT